MYQNDTRKMQCPSGVRFHNLFSIYKCLTENSLRNRMKSTPVFEQWPQVGAHHVNRNGVDETRPRNKFKGSQLMYLIFFWLYLRLPAWWSGEQVSPPMLERV